MGERHDDRRRQAMAKTAKTLRDAASKAGNSISHTEALARVQGADRKRSDRGDK